MVAKIKKVWYNIYVMDIIYTENSVVLNNPKDFNICHIFDCGQCFRFNRISENTYFGIAYGKALEIEQTNDKVILHGSTKEDFLNIWKGFLDLDRDYGEIKSALSNDDIMRKAISCGEGIRILNQATWETIISFIISASNNIPRIKGIIERLCESFGNPVKYKGKTYYSFPSAEKINSLSLEELSVIRAGFRDKYIKAAAEAVVSGSLSLDELHKMSTPEAKKALMGIRGIGNKVSDCILLFGLGRADSFPVDVWIKRIMEYCYFGTEQPIKKISEFADERFATLGGYAQQYLFFYARENKIGLNDGRIL